MVRRYANNGRIPSLLEIWRNTRNGVRDTGARAAAAAAAAVTPSSTSQDVEAAKTTGQKGQAPTSPATSTSSAATNLPNNNQVAFTTKNK